MMCKMDGSLTVGPIDFHVLDGERTLNEGLLLEVEVQAPNRIRFASQEWLDVFQLSKEEISGRTLMIISGPATNLQQLKGVIASAVQGKEARTNVYCYSRAGIGKHMVVRARPNRNGDGSTCFLSMLVSDAVPLKDATFGEDTARAIVSANHPHIVEHVNARFSAEFGYPLEVLAGKTLRMIHGPRTDAQTFGALLQAAKAGFSRSGVLEIYSAECSERRCDVRLLPLLGHGGDISHLLAIFSPASLQCPSLNLAEVAPPPTMIPHDSTAFSHPSHVHHRISHPFPPPSAAASHDRALPLWGLSSSSSLDRPASTASSVSSAHHHVASGLSLHPSGSPPDFSFSPPPPAAPSPAPAPSDITSSGARAAAGFDGGGNGESGSTSELNAVWGGDTSTSLKLIPRKKRLSSADGSGALELSVQKLQEMGRISMKQAAMRLGIAPSTLKKACRKLGVERWPHGAHSEHASKTGKSWDYDASYVRRLFNKYGDKKGGEVEERPAAAQPELQPAHASGFDGPGEGVGFSGAPFAQGGGDDMDMGQRACGEGGGGGGGWQAEVDITIGSPLDAEGRAHVPAGGMAEPVFQVAQIGASLSDSRVPGPFEGAQDGVCGIYGNFKLKEAGMDTGPGGMAAGAEVRGVAVASGREGEGEAMMMDDVCALFDAAVNGLHHHHHHHHQQNPPPPQHQQHPHPHHPGQLENHLQRPDPSKPSLSGWHQPPHQPTDAEFAHHSQVHH